MGVIIKFPVIVTNQRATEDQYGITPQLCSYVSLSGSTSAVVSEHGIAVALNSLSATLSADSIGVGDPAFDSLSTDIDGTIFFRFNSLSGMGQLYTNQTDNTISLNSYQAGFPGTTADFVVTKKTLNGGVYQQSKTITYDMTNPVNLFQVKSEWAIGKILMRCTEAFDSTSLQMSIGFGDNPSAFVLPFSVPTTISTNKLVNFTYGTLMNDKIQFVESSDDPSISGSSNNLIDGQYVNAYFYGASRGTQGKIKCVIFYDINENDNDLI